MNPAEAVSPQLTPGDLEAGAEVLRAIAHPSRISILSLLEQKGSLSVKEIQEALGMEQAAVSHHLGIMRDKGILHADREGKSIFYSLKMAKLTQIVHCLASLGLGGSK